MHHTVEEVVPAAALQQEEHSRLVQFSACSEVLEHENEQLWSWDGRVDCGCVFASIGCRAMRPLEKIKW